MTREEVQLEYLAAIDGADTGHQALAFQRLCDSMFHLGWMQGFTEMRQLFVTEMGKDKLPVLHGI
jgi:hypothetical protein